MYSYSRARLGKTRAMMSKNMKGRGGNRALTGQKEDTIVRGWLARAGVSDAMNKDMGGVARNWKVSKVLQRSDNEPSYAHS